MKAVHLAATTAALCAISLIGIFAVPRGLAGEPDSVGMQPERFAQAQPPAQPKQKQAPARTEVAPPAAPTPPTPPQPAAPASPVRTETIVYDNWTVICRDTVDGKTKKLCEDCADLAHEKDAVAAESESVVQNMMGFKGRR